MTDVRTTQGYVLAAVAAAGGDVRVSQLYAFAATQFPSQEIRYSQGYVHAAVQFGMDVRTTQAYVLAAVKGRPLDNLIRAWTFTLDGHDYYVLKLGEIETLVYDTHAEEWYVWGTADTNLWNLMDGTNWAGGVTSWAGGYGSNVVAGSNTNGALFFLDPEATDDDAALADASVQPYRREAMAQYVMRGTDFVPCFGVQAYGSIGEVLSNNPTDVSLEISDDRGHSFFDCGTVSITVDDYNARASWTSLGSMSAPGRLFKVIDYGAMHRIDMLDMQDPPESKSRAAKP